MNVNKLAMKYENVKDKIKNHSYITMTDNSVLDIEYCKKVLKFEDNVIELKLAKSSIRIVGLDLSMKNYAFDCVKIYGKIHSITFDSNTEGNFTDENEKEE